MPNWNDFNMRLGGAVDLFGNGRTAIKGSINRYVAGQAVDIAGRFKNAVVSAGWRLQTT